MYSNGVVGFYSTTISTCRDAKAISFYNELEIHTTAMFYLHRGRSSKVRNDVAANYDENVNITCVCVRSIECIYYTHTTCTHTFVVQHVHEKKSISSYVK